MAEPEDLKLFNTLAPLIGLAVLVALGVILMVHQFQRSLFRRRLREENLKTDHQRELLRTAITVQEQERQRIAGDLHDELGARLSMTLLLLRQNTTSKSALEDHTSQLFIELEEHLNQALIATKRISYELMPPQLVNLGLYRAVLVLADEARKAGNLKVNLVKKGMEAELPWPLQIGLYRIISELLNNTLKHGAASEINIDLIAEKSRLSCHYRDNGMGLPQTLLAKGLGLKNLEGRATALNGNFEYGNIPEGGFFAKINIPVTT
jgi:signal transduction histidine kinase